MTKFATNPHHAHTLLPVSCLAMAEHKRFSDKPDVLRYGQLYNRENTNIIGMVNLARRAVLQVTLFNGQQMARYLSSVTTSINSVLFTAHTYNKKIGPYGPELVWHFGTEYRVYGI